MDFTLKTYKLLLNALQHKGYSFQTFSQYIIEKKNSLPVTDHSLLILRHDVEARYKQALKFAQIQNRLGIKGTYFFRLLPKSFKPEIVKQIADLGHEIGYHYDDLAQCKGDYKKAIERFQKNLETLREIAPVQTICMDGSPLSKYDNKDLWRRDGDTSTPLSVTDTSTHFVPTAIGIAQHESLSMTEGKGEISQFQAPSPKPHAYYSYKDFGIIGEPYFDIDFSQVFYLTDTGRMWNGEQYSVRDKVLKEKAADWPNYHKTDDIINAIEKGDFPMHTMLTFHPQRWNDAFGPWLKELLWQNAKNQIKRILVIKSNLA